jgi:hypothetical protein
MILKGCKRRCRDFTGVCVAGVRCNQHFGHRARGRFGPCQEPLDDSSQLAGVARVELPRYGGSSDALLMLS